MTIWDVHVRSPALGVGLDMHLFPQLDPDGPLVHSPPPAPGDGLSIHLDGGRPYVAQVQEVGTGHAIFRCNGKAYLVSTDDRWHDSRQVWRVRSSRPDDEPG